MLYILLGRKCEYVPFFGHCMAIDASNRLFFLQLWCIVNEWARRTQWHEGVWKEECCFVLFIHILLGQHHCCLPLHPTTASPRTVFSWPKSLCSLPTSKDWRRWPADQLFLALRGMRHGVGRRVAKKKQGGDGRKLAATQSKCRQWERHKFKPQKEERHTFRRCPNKPVLLRLSIYVAISRRPSSLCHFKFNLAHRRDTVTISINTWSYSPTQPTMSGKARWLITRVTRVTCVAFFVNATPVTYGHVAE